MLRRLTARKWQSREGGEPLSPGSRSPIAHLLPGTPAVPPTPPGKPPPMALHLNVLGSRWWSCMWARAAGPAQAPVPTLAFTVGIHCSSQRTRQSHWNGFPRRSLGQEAGEGLRPGFHSLRATLPTPPQARFQDRAPEWCGKYVGTIAVILICANQEWAQMSPSPTQTFPNPPTLPAPLSLTRESGSPGLGTGIWGGSRDGYWPGFWWRERRRNHQQLPGYAVCLGDGCGVPVREGWGDGGTHRCVSERSPLRAFLEMEPISLSSIKLWREDGVRGRPLVPCCGPTVLGELTPWKP